MRLDDNFNNSYMNNAIKLSYAVNLASLHHFLKCENMHAI